MNSAPERKTGLNEESISSAIGQLHANKPLRLVVFAGGEPTLLGGELLNSIAYASDLGIVTRMVTNAYWATTEEAARKKLNELRDAGLMELNISTDDYHLPYIPFERVINAWKGSKNLGFQAVILVNCYHKNSMITPAYLRQELQEDIPLHFDEQGHPFPHQSYGKDKTTYKIFNSFVQAIGRARKHLLESDFFYAEDQSELNGACQWCVKSAALSPYNKLVTCCGIEAHENEILELGDLNKTTVTEVLERANNNLLVNAIAIFGPKFLMDFLKQKAPELHFHEKYTAICEICEHITTRTEVVAALKKNSAELAELVLSVQEQQVKITQ